MTCREKYEKKLTVGDVNEASRLGESTIVGTALKYRQSHTSEYKVRQIVP